MLVLRSGNDYLSFTEREWLSKSYLEEGQQLFAAVCQSEPLKSPAYRQILGFVCNALALLPLLGANLYRRAAELTCVLVVEWLWVLFVICWLFLPSQNQHAEIFVGRSRQQPSHDTHRVRCWRFAVGRCWCRRVLIPSDPSPRSCYHYRCVWGTLRFGLPA